MNEPHQNLPSTHLASSGRSPVSYEIELSHKIQSGHVLSAMATIDASGISRPYEQTDDQARKMVELWCDHLKSFCIEALRRSIRIIIATNRKWPTVAEVVELTRNAENELRAEKDFAYRRTEWKKHPMRAMPPGEVNYQQAVVLRRHPIWEEWLDAIHPAQEHSWFRLAQCHDATPWHIIVPTPFEQEKIEIQFDMQLTKLFENGGKFRVDNKQSLERRAR